MALKYLFFDFDGVILDSEPLYQRFWIEACKENGFILSKEKELNLRSSDHQRTQEYFKELFGETADYEKIHSSRVRLMNEYLINHKIPLKKDVYETLKQIKEETDLKIVIVSSSSIDYVDHHSKENGIRDLIDEIVSVKNVEHGKPYPDVYLKALEITNANKDEVLVIEDSPNGVKAGYHANLDVVFIEDLSPADEEINQYSKYQLKSIKELIQILNLNN